MVWFFTVTCDPPAISNLINIYSTFKVSLTHDVYYYSTDWSIFLLVFWFQEFRLHSKMTMLKSSTDDNGSYAIQNSACQIEGWKPKATDPTFQCSKQIINRPWKRYTLLTENASKFNLSLCVGKSRLLTQSCQLQTARNNTPGKLGDFLESWQASFQLR